MAKIFINPGHAPGGNPDPGACNPATGLRESDVAAAIGAKVAQYLDAVGYATQVLQSDSLEEIVSAANAWPADVFVSIHCNAANGLARGAETWYYYNSSKGQYLAQCIQWQVVNSIPLVDRGTKGAKPGRNGLYVLTNTAMPAVLVETAFIDNPEDAVLLSDPAWQDEFARAIARGVSDYFA